MIEYQVKIYEDGKQEWWLNGKRHREDGPAVIDGNYQAWYQNEKRHREDGPAFIDGDRQEWWLNGEELTEEEFIKRTQPVKELTIAKISELLGCEVKPQLMNEL